MASSGNFATWNPLANTLAGLSYSGSVYSNGNTRFRGNTGGTATTQLTHGLPSGKWYIEFFVDGSPASGFPMIGIVANGDNSNTLQNTSNAAALTITSDLQMVSGEKRVFGSSSSATYGSGFSDEDICQMAIDIDNGKIWWGKNNTWFASGDPAAGSNAGDTFTALTEMMVFVGSYSGASYMICNAGQDDTFGGEITGAGNADGNGFGAFKYSPPTGFLSVTSSNLSVSDDIDPAQTSTDIGEEQFNVVTYTGNGTNNNAITGLGFQPDLVWTKDRGNTADYSNAQVDSSRGRAKVLYSQRTDGEPSDSGTNDDVKSFDSDGFTVGTGNNIGINASAHTYVGWCWKASGGVAQDKTYAVTVVSDSGNKYRLDGHGTSAITIDVNEGSTITFDQSDNSNDGHPLRIYTAADKTGGEYTTGVTTSGTPGTSGAKTVITVAASAPTLYYQCSIHGLMGGQINTNALSAGIGNSHTAGTIISNVQKNTKAGFSIVTYTANGSANQTWGHGLSAKPDLIMVKKRSATSTWTVYHSSLGATKYLYLSSTASVYTGSEMWNDTEPTSSLVTVNNNGNTNGSNGDLYMSYVWHSVEGYSKFGTYVGAGGGNSATDNTFVYTGFRPRFLFVKNTGAASSWIVYDTAQKTFNPMTVGATWNESGAAFDNSNYAIDILSNGFKFRTGNATVNTTDTWIYGAWGDVPFKYNNTF